VVGQKTLEAYARGMTEDGATTLEDTVEGGRRNMKRARRESHDWMGHGNNCGQKSLSRAMMGSPRLDE